MNRAMKKHVGVAAMLAVFVFSISFSGCGAHQGNSREDTVAMYGQPQIPRSEALKAADEDFIKRTTASYGGSREKASKVWWKEGDRYIGQGKLDAAMMRYNQSWLLNPNNYLPYWGFARVELERDRFDESIEHFEKAIQLCDDQYEKVALLSDAGVAYSFKAAQISQKDKLAERIRYFKKANSYFKESADLDPTYGHVWKRWAQSLFREGNYSESWVKIKKAKSLGVTGIDDFVQALTKAMPEPQ